MDGIRPRLRGSYVAEDDTLACPPVPLADQVPRRTGDVIGVVRYATRWGSVFVMERRPSGRTTDVLVWGSVPNGVLLGVPKGDVARALERSSVKGSIDDSPIVLTRRGTRPWVVGRSRLVVRRGPRAWTCRTERLTHVAIRRSDGERVAIARTHVALSDTTDRLEVTLALLLLHGRWLNTVRGALSNTLTSDPIGLDTFALADTPDA